MKSRVLTGSAALAASCLLSGCHHRAAVTAIAPPPVAPATAGPVMVSVPPPTHHSGDMPDGVAVRSTIPVVKPVSPPRRIFRRSSPPAVASTTPAVTAPTAPVAVASAPAVNLGQLTSSTDDPAATRDGAANAIRRERDRLAGVSASLQSTHASEVEQARRFLKSASDSWNAADYSATLALATKARVLLDDLLK